MATFGTGALRYTVIDNWARKLQGWPYTDVVGVATDRRDRVFVFTRSAHPDMVFDKDGAFVRSWGEGRFVWPHGIYIDAADNVWCTDGMAHTVTKWDTNGNQARWQTAGLTHHNLYIRVCVGRAMTLQPVRQVKLFALRRIQTYP